MSRAASPMSAPRSPVGGPDDVPGVVGNLPDQGMRLHRRPAAVPGSRARLMSTRSWPEHSFVRDPRFSRGGAPVVEFLLLTGDFSAWRLLIIEPQRLRFSLP